MITDAEARRLSCEWHGGGGSALYALCSSGAIDTARANHYLWGEIDHLRASLVKPGGGHVYGDKRAEVEAELAALQAYAVAHHPRGPVEGWSSLWPD